MDNTILQILQTLTNHCFSSYIVGGYVRDYLLGIKSTDIDITTQAKPKDVIKILKDYDLKVSEYGNVSLKVNNYDVEITTMREEYNYSDSRRPDKIKYIKDIKKDLKRRDFTINTICMDQNQEIIDYLDGRKDLKNKLIKMIQNPNQRIKEDSLRILRAIRFATILKFKIEKELKKAITSNKDLLYNLSYERKKEELTKIFSNENKKYGIKLIKELHLEEPLELHDIDKALKTNDIIGIYASIFSENYPTTKTEKNLINEIKKLEKENLDNNKVWYKYGIYPLLIVCDLKGLNKSKYAKKYEKLPIKDRSDILITTKEICEILNIKPSSMIKEIYTDLENKILDNKLKNNNDEIKDYLYNQYML